MRRDWRRRGLATALKRAELAWAAANGIREIVTWTQRGNDGMRAANERLGYVYRSVSVTMRAPIRCRRHARLRPRRSTTGSSSALARRSTATFTVIAVYFVQEVGMNPLELVLVGTVME